MRVGKKVSKKVETLKEFARERGATYFRDWPESSFQGTMREMVLGRARSAKQVHFNLDGFRNKGSSIRDAVRRGRAREHFGEEVFHTERELYWILRDPALRAKTTFYRGGVAVENPANLFGDVWDIR